MGFRTAVEVEEVVLETRWRDDERMFVAIIVVMFVVRCVIGIRTRLVLIDEMNELGRFKVVVQRLRHIWSGYIYTYSISHSSPPHNASAKIKLSSYLRNYINDSAMKN